MFFRSAVFVLLLGNFIAQPCLATVVPTPDIDRLTAQSTVIILGELVTVERGIGQTTAQVNGQAVSARLDRGLLRVDEVLRGKEQTSLLFEMTTPEGYDVWRLPAQQDFGLFFFRTGDNGKVVFTDPYYAYIRLPQNLHTRGETALDRVVSVLGDLLSLPNNRDLNLSALHYLEFSKSKAANTLLQTALRNTADPQLRIPIGAGLLRQGDVTSLGFIKETFLTGSRISLDSQQEEALGNTMAYFLNDPAGIPDLVELLGASSVQIRRGAAGALRRMHSPKAADGLAKALTDADSTVRYWGVAGLAELTGEDRWRPNEELFKANELEYLQHWKDWARKQPSK